VQSGIVTKINKKITHMKKFVLMKRKSEIRNPTNVICTHYWCAKSFILLFIAWEIHIH